MSEVIDLRIGRPGKVESRRRTARFLELVAHGEDFRDAARHAGVKAERALDLVQDRDRFEEQVAAIRRTLEVPDALHGAERSAEGPRQAA